MYYDRGSAAASAAVRTLARELIPENITAATVSEGNTYKNLYEATSMNSGLTVVVIINILVSAIGLLFYRYVILREAGLLTRPEIEILAKYPGNRVSQTYTPSDAYVRAPPPVRWTGWHDFFTGKDHYLSRDAQVYLLFQRACILTTACCGIFATFVLLPFYWSGGAIFRVRNDPGDGQKPLTLLNMLSSDRGVFERFTSHNLPPDSALVLLQFPVIVIVAFCIVILYTVVKKVAGEQRTTEEWLRPTSATLPSPMTTTFSPTSSPTSTPRASRRRPHQGWTVFARGLPRDILSAQELTQMLTAIYPMQVARVELVCKGRMSEAKLSRALESARYRYDYLHAMEDDEVVDPRFASQTIFGRAFGLFVRQCSREEVLEALRSQIVSLEREVESRKTQPVQDFLGCAFITFKTANAAESSMNDFPMRHRRASWIQSLFRRGSAGRTSSFGINRRYSVLSSHELDERRSTSLTFGFPSMSNLYRGLLLLLPEAIRNRLHAPTVVLDTNSLNNEQPSSGRSIGYSPQLAATRLRHMKATRAPKSGDIVWDNIGISFFERTIREIIVQFIVFAILILFTSPIAMLTAVKLLVSEVALLSDPQVILNNLHRNGTAITGVASGNMTDTPLFPHIDLERDNVAKWIADSVMKSLPSALSSNPLLRSAIFAYVPVLLLAIVFAVVPSLLRLTCRMEGYPTHSAQEMSVFRKTAFYYVMNAVVLPSLALNTTSEFLEIIYTKSNGGANVYSALPILERLFSGDIAFFLCNYIVQLALSGSVFWLLRLPSSFSMMIRRRMALTPLEAAEAKCTDIFDFPRHYAYCVTVMSMCLLFGYMAPLVWWFALMYFLCKHAVDLYLIRYVHPRSHIDGRLPRVTIGYILVWTAVSQLSLGVIFYLQGRVKAGIATVLLCALTLAACLSAGPTVGNRILAWIAETRGRIMEYMLRDKNNVFSWALAPPLVVSSSGSSSSDETKESDALLGVAVDAPQDKADWTQVVEDPAGEASKMQPGREKGSDELQDRTNRLGEASSQNGKPPTGFRADGGDFEDGEEESNLFQQSLDDEEVRRSRPGYSMEELHTNRRLMYRTFERGSLPDHLNRIP